VSEYSGFLSPIEDVIADARNGRMFILVDAEDRENEGDLVVPAQMCTPEAVNFMARYGRGLICLSLTPQRAAQLDLKLMPQSDGSRRQTAFTISIEARDGVSTGISAHDRARTISVAIDPTKGAEDLVTPGHVFPLVAREGGVLVRAGHTEAAVDVARLAGLNPAGVICEIMNDDGTMARLPDLVTFAQAHGLKIATIADLIAYRRRHDHFIVRKAETRVNSVHGGAFRMYVYANTLEYAEHVALVKGDISGPDPVPVRVHAANLTNDVLGLSPSKSDVVRNAMRWIEREGRGVLVIIRDTTATSLSDFVNEGANSGAPAPRELRHYGIGAQILLDLGLTDMVLLSNSPRQAVIGLEGYGLRIVGQCAIPDEDHRGEHRT